jgi:hypothetical protein
MTTRKLSAPSREIVERLEGTKATVSIILRGRATFTASELKTLAEDGARIRTRAGDIVTADVSIDALDRILAHDFVVSCEISQPLYRDK